MSPSSMQGGSGQEATIVRHVLVGVALLAVAFFLGRLISVDVFLPTAVVVLFGLMYLLLRRPAWFLMMAIFFYFRTMQIVDTDVVGRIAGLFRLKDVFFAVLLLHIIATEVIHRSDRVVPKSAKSFRLFLLFMTWLGFEMWRTVFLLGEGPVLMFRVSRHFLSYGFFFFLLYYLRSEREWEMLRRCMYGFAFLTMFLGLLTAMGINITIYPRGAAMIGRYFRGVFKFYNPGESLVFAMFMYSVWRYCFRPTMKNGVVAALLAGGCTFFIFRARLAGVALGMVVALFFAPARVRARAILLGVVLTVCVVVLLSVFGLIAANAGELGRDSYLGALAEYFNDAARGLTQKNTDDVMGRQLFVAARWPLVKEHPVAGIGFISPFGEIAWELFRMGEMPIGHVDVGWLDALMRFGVVGITVLSLFLISVAVEGRRLLQVQGLSENEYAFALTAIGFVVLMFVSTYSFAYPTREEPILTLSLIFAWLLQSRRKLQGFKPAGGGASDPAGSARVPQPATTFARGFRGVR